MPYLNSLIVGDSVDFAANDEMSLIIEEEYISFIFLVGLEMGVLFYSQKKTWFHVEIFNFGFDVVLWQLMGTLLLGHFKVGIVLGM